MLREDAVLQVTAHESEEDYSSWLLPAVEQSLKRAGLGMADVDGYAVASGPGSFTGLRVGLTTVKAWREVYDKPIAAVSRLEAFAVQNAEAKVCVAAFADAHRGQVFGAVYRRRGAGLERQGEEMVIAPGAFVETAAELAKGQGIAWVSPDGSLISREAAWRDREKRGEGIETVSSVVAPLIGRLGVREWKEGRSTDALTLDANYVRRSDAEIFWKSRAGHGR